MLCHMCHIENNSVLARFLIAWSENTRRKYLDLNSVKIVRSRGILFLNYLPYATFCIPYHCFALADTCPNIGLNYKRKQELYLFILKIERGIVVKL